MIEYDLKCPQCGKIIQKLRLTGNMSAKLCSNCRIRFDVKVDSQSSKTGHYTTTNIRRV